jgi:hypothetical protein
LQGDGWAGEDAGVGGEAAKGLADAAGEGKAEGPIAVVGCVVKLEAAGGWAVAELDQSIKGNGIGARVEGGQEPGE